MLPIRREVELCKRATFINVLLFEIFKLSIHSFMFYCLHVSFTCVVCRITAAYVLCFHSYYKFIDIFLLFSTAYASMRKA